MTARLVSAVAVVAAAACSKPYYPPPYQEQVKEVRADSHEGPRAATVAASVAGGYTLPAATATAPMPAAPAHYVFVGADGSLRVGHRAEYADARFVKDVAEAAAELGLRRPSPAEADPQAAHRAVAERVDLAPVVVVVVMDRGAPAGAAVRLADGLGQPVVLAVDGGVAPFAIRATAAPGSSPLTLAGEQTFSELVSQLDAAATAGSASVGLIALPATAEQGRSGGALAITIDHPHVDPGLALNLAVVGRQVNQNGEAIHACADKHLRETREGSVTARFVIGADGTVVDTTATGTDGFDAVATCVARIMQGAEFPRPKGGVKVDVSYVVTFRPAP